jgi:hypothetical protein
MKKATRLILIYIVIIVGITACSVVELVVENQATSRSLSEAKRDPNCSGDDVDKQTSVVTRESSEDRNLDIDSEK